MVFNTIYFPLQHHHHDDHHDKKHKKHKNGHSKYHRHKFVLTFEENEYIEKEIAEKVTAEWKAIYREEFVGILGSFLSITWPTDMPTMAIVNVHIELV